MKRTLLLIGLLTLITAQAFAARFIDNGNGTITDTRTGLIWEQKTDDGGLRDKDNRYTWKQALAYCENLTLASQTDWRLPNIKELASLVDLSRYSPSIDPVFAPYTRPSFYWSSSTLAGYANGAWGVYFDYGYDNWYGKSGYGYVRAVRGGQGG